MSTLTPGQGIALPAHSPFPAALATKGSVFFLSYVACVHLSCNQTTLGHPTAAHPYTWKMWASVPWPPNRHMSGSAAGRDVVRWPCTLAHQARKEKNPLASKIVIVIPSLIIFGECYHNANLTLRNLQQIPKTALLALPYDPFSKSILHRSKLLSFPFLM